MQNAQMTRRQFTVRDFRHDANTETVSAREVSTIFLVIGSSLLRRIRTTSIVSATMALLGIHADLALSQQGRVVTTSFTSPALEGNLQGDPATRSARVYLPPSYHGSPSKRYPVVYLLHGTGGDENEFFFPNGAHTAADSGIPRGTIDEMIVVGVDASSKYSVSYYVNSELNGRHEEYIVTDLVNHIDTEFRTLANRESRGVAGFSTGGYGALRYGMKHSDVFGAVYSLSGGGICWSRPECSLYLSDESAVYSPQLRSLFDDIGGILAGVQNPSDIMNIGFPARALREEMFSLAAAFSPNLDNPPLLADLPFEVPSLKTVPGAREAWIEHDLFTLLEVHVEELKSLRGLALDIGDRDEFGLFSENQAFHAALTGAGVSHQYEVYSGFHNTNRGGRIAQVLEFFSDVMVTTPGDYDDDRALTVADIDMLTSQIVAGTNKPAFDLTGDEIVNSADQIRWLAAAATDNGFGSPYLRGDSNLDGVINAIDLNNLALNWRQSTAAWTRGDFTADGFVNATDLNELALNWRGVVPFAGTVPIEVDSDRYVQSFDEALGADGAVPGSRFPAGWTVTDNGIVSDSTMRSFPIGATMSGSRDTVAAYNAGAENDTDRTLAVGVSGSEDDLSIRLLTHITGSDADSFQLQFDVEAWDAVDGIRIGNNIIAGPDDPGEAAFRLTVDIDSGDGFESLVDLGTVTTGSTLDPVFEGMVDRNLDANRIMFDSGIVSADIPANSKLRFRWAPDFDAQTNGWVYGIDNVSLQFLSAGATTIPASVPEPSALPLVVTGFALFWRRPTRN